MSTSTLSYAASAAAPLQAPGTGSVRREHVGFWRAPFAAVTYREIGHVLVSLPVAIAGFGFAVAAVALGAGLLVTVLGLPVLAAALAAARGLGPF
ncbi:sensor domain-containing protein [Streptomyces kanamyceticus]|uniref:Putative sensor domain-containing protein n=1 Tax=Streptomyces kanamyceticus TaxID=1967 RepID=A0A5J6GJI9_STRKN|nr:hypothetical protein CP970_22330 [Streptomyces kanamyceticus]